MTKKKKILFLINNLGGGGAEKVLVNLVNNMNPNKYQITLRTLVDQGQNKPYLSDSIKYESVFKRGFRGINYLNLLPQKYIYTKVAHGSFDLIIVYLHGVLTKIVSYAPDNQKTIAYLHGNMQNSPFIKSFRTKYKLQTCFNSYNAIVSVSQSVEDSFIKASEITKNLHVVYNTFDVSRIKRQAEKQVTTNKKNSDIVILCAVGKLIKVKGFDRLIRVLGKIKKETSTGFKLFIIGDGQGKNKLENLIAAQNLSKEIVLTGFQENPYKYIANSDLTVSSSLSEGFSSVVVESIILGTPVLTTKTSGMTEILGENDEYGIVVENNEESLYQGLKKILLKPDLLSHYKEKAAERSDFFSTEKSVSDVEQLIDRIIADE